MNALRSISLRAGALLLLAVALSACGFQLRGSSGQYQMPFNSIYLGFADTSPLGIELRRNLRAGTSTRIVTRREDAEAILTPIGEARTKTILSLSSNGRVREFRLRYNFSFRITDPRNRDIIAPVTLLIERDFPFNDSAVLAKEAEEALLYRDMQSDMVQQTLRRLAAAQRLPPAGRDEN